MVRLSAAWRRWVDADATVESGLDPARVDWVRGLPFVAMHLACLGVIWVGVSPVAAWVAAGLYVLRVFALTAFYHRYFSHRSFRTSRPVQFLFAFIGATAAQRGPIWWAAHHRHHHVVSDAPEDPHSPHQHGFWHSHACWFLTGQHFGTDDRRVRDLLKYPELRFLDRYAMVAPLLLALALYALGSWLAATRPELGTSGGQMVIWGFFVSTVAVYHVTFLVNSLAHRWGTRRYETTDDSRNNWLVAIVAYGEGWHNNHHAYPRMAKHGHRWWEFDITWQAIRLLRATGLVWDVVDYRTAAEKRENEAAQAT